MDLTLVLEESMKLLAHKTRHLASENSSEVHKYIDRYADSTITQNGMVLTYNIPRKGGYLKQQTGTSGSYTLRAQLNYDKKLNEDHSHQFNIWWRDERSH